MGVKSVTAVMKALRKRKFGTYEQNPAIGDLDLPGSDEFTSIGPSGVSFMFRQKTAEKGFTQSDDDLSSVEEQDLADTFSEIMFRTIRLNEPAPVHLAKTEFPNAVEGNLDHEIAELVDQSATHNMDVDLVPLKDFDIESLGDPDLFDDVKKVLGNFKIEHAVYDEKTDKIIIIAEIETTKHPITGTIVDSVRKLPLETNNSKYAVIELFEGHEPFINNNQCTLKEARDCLGIVTGLKKSASAYGPLTI